MRRILCLIASLGVILVDGGCMSAMLARKLVQAPNRQELPKNLAEADVSKLLEKDNPGLLKRSLNMPPSTESWRIAVPDAEIAVTTIAAGEHKSSVDLKVTRGRAEKRSANFQLVFSDKIRAEKGTIIVLHGICVAKESMLPWALYLSAAGYRTVLVDLRGHGESTGDYITYGKREAADLTAVLDRLENRGMARGKVGVLGISYGAVVGLHWAARDSRIGALVALEPFSDSPQAIASFVREAVGGPLALLSPARLDHAMAQAAQQAGFSWSEVNVIESVEKIPFPILFYHGAQDNLLPLWHSANLKNFARPGSRLVIMPDDDHFTLAMRLEPMAAEARTWFDEHLNATGAAPASQP